jgi:hypothetical protein
LNIYKKLWYRSARRRINHQREMWAKALDDLKNSLALITDQCKLQSKIRGEKFDGLYMDITLERLELMLGADRLREILRDYGRLI